MKHRMRRSRKGQSLVEFAFILPIFLLILVGIFDVGRGVFAYHTLNNAAREGGRQAIVDQTQEHVQSRAAQHAVGLGVQADDVLVDYRLNTSEEVPGSCNSQVGKDQIYGCLAVVQVPYTYTAATPIIGNLIGTLVLTGEVRFPVEFNCAEPSKPQCPVAE
jgi:Flp pilus assembly protein TadG